MDDRKDRAPEVNGVALTMNDHHRETAFLRQCIRYDDTEERHRLEERITQIQGDERIVRRAVWLMALLAALAMSGLGYAAVFMVDYPVNVSQLTTRFVIKVLCVLGGGSLFCLFGFLVLGVIFRREMHRRRADCRRLALKVLEARLGQPYGARPLVGVKEPVALVVLPTPEILEMDSEQMKNKNESNNMTTTPLKTGKVLGALGVILSLCAVPLIGSLTGCAGDRYTQSTGERIDDKADSNRVRRALSSDTQYKYGDVNVSTFKGVVQLSGFVNSRDQKNRAGDLAKTVEGVREVENNITVKESVN